MIFKKISVRDIQYDFFINKMYLGVFNGSHLSFIRMQNDGYRFTLYLKQKIRCYEI